MPALASARCDAGVGAVSMITGSVAGGRHRADARARLEAVARAYAGDAISTTAAAPSTMPDELPAVWTCSIVATCG